MFTVLWTIVLSGVGAPWDPSTIKNPDAMVRLERVRQLMDGEGWFNQILARVGTMDHLELHWTRPVDVVLAGAAWGAQHFTDATTALIASGVLISFPMGLLCLILASRLPTLLDERHPLSLGIGALFIALSPHFFLLFAAPSWPDHHGFMIVLFLAALISGHRMLTTPKPFRWAWALGLAQALAIWISPESLLAVAALNIGAGLLWMFNLNAEVALRMRTANMILSGGIICAIAVEYGPNLPGVELDRLSFFSLAIGTILWAMWSVFAVFQNHFSTSFRRFGLACATTTVGIGLMLFLNPNALGGPMGEADTWFVKVWTGFFSDGFWMSPDGATLTYVAALACAWFWSKQELNSPDKTWVIIYLLPTFVVFAALSLSHSSRWVPYAELIAMVFIIALFAHLARKISQTPPSLLRYAFSSITALSFVLLANINILSSSLKQSDKTNEKSVVSQQCDLNGLLERLNALSDSRGPQRVMGYANITPAIALHTPHRIQAIPIHPDARAVRHSVDVFITETQAPRNIDADLLIMCTVGHERVAFGEREQALYSRLMRSEHVDGIEEIKPSQIKGDKPPYHIFELAKRISKPQKLRP
ncbi:hypothetical protein V5T82_17160 [Magnetovibrio sp. PR-2]|uniref:hypothetical protein n=1 Tax=Magnetovibrio sp. PR-2 TaxID=3120356 RepID=UPI002FCE0572